VVVGCGKKPNEQQKGMIGLYILSSFGGRSEATDHRDGELERFEAIGLPWSLKTVSLASPSSGRIKICLRA